MPTGGGTGGAAGGSRLGKGSRIGFERQQSPHNKSMIANMLHSSKFARAGEDNAGGFVDAEAKVVNAATAMEKHLYGDAAAKNNWWG